MDAKERVHTCGEEGPHGVDFHRRQVAHVDDERRLDVLQTLARFTLPDIRYVLKQPPHLLAALNVLLGAVVGMSMR